MTKAQKRAQRKATRASARARKAGGSKRRRTAGRRKAGKRTVALRNLKKARSVRARRKRAGGAKHKVRGYSYTRKAKRVRVKSHKSYEASESKPRKRRSSRRRKHRAAEASESPKKRRSSRKRRTGGRRRKLSMKKSAVAARRRRRSHAREASESPRRSRKRRSSGRRRSSRRHKVKGHYARSRSGRKHRVKAHYSRETSRRRRRSSGRRRRHHSRRHHSARRRSSRRRGYSMENPLEPMEILVGALTGTLGFIAADALDRVWATHALLPNPGIPTGTDGKPNWTDNPAMTGGSYPGLYNATAVLAPMDWKRWLSGVGITAAPFLLALANQEPGGPQLAAALRIRRRRAHPGQGRRRPHGQVLRSLVLGRTPLRRRGPRRCSPSGQRQHGRPDAAQLPDVGPGRASRGRGSRGLRVRQLHHGRRFLLPQVGQQRLCRRPRASRSRPTSRPTRWLPSATQPPAMMPPATMTPTAPPMPPPPVPAPASPPAQYVPRLPSAPSTVTGLTPGFVLAVRGGHVRWPASPHQRRRAQEPLRVGWTGRRVIGHLPYDTTLGRAPRKAPTLLAQRFAEKDKTFEAPEGRKPAWVGPV